MIQYPWYEIINGRHILQGDILESFEVLFPTESNISDEKKVKIKAEIYDVVVVSQSCDIEECKIDLVLLCPLTDIDTFKNSAPDFFKGKSGLNQIRQGVIPGLHMIAECNIQGFERPIKLANFHKIYSMPVDYVKDFAERKGNRIRLNPPYREHLSQSLARFFMRVGLPINIPKF